MRNLWERFRSWWTFSDAAEFYLRDMERMARDAERHREMMEQARQLDAAQARRELRDRFAMAALTGMMASRNPSCPQFHPEDDAAYVYAVADAMLKARGDD